MSDQLFETLYNSRKEKLYFYSPYTFIRAVSPETQLQHYVLSPIKNSLDKQEYIEIHEEGEPHIFIIQKLDWDTEYFGIDTYRLNYALFAHNDTSILGAAIKKLTSQLKGKYYLFAELPSEDTELIQALGIAGGKLIETRLTYYCDKNLTLNDERYEVRMANEADIPNLKKVAMSMRNIYDRFHADKIFSEEKADAFLATYIEQSIKGFADVVMIPKGDNDPSDSFLTAKYLKDEWADLGANVSKMVLSAVSAQTNKGWYKKLISEMTHHLKEYGADHIFMNTQSTNKAVVHVWESLGYKYGKTTHIMSISN